MLAVSQKKSESHRLDAHALAGTRKWQHSSVISIWGSEHEASAQVRPDCLARFDARGRALQRPLWRCAMSRDLRSEMVSRLHRAFQCRSRADRYSLLTFDAGLVCPRCPKLDVGGNAFVEFLGRDPLHFEANPGKAPIVSTLERRSSRPRRHTY